RARLRGVQGGTPLRRLRSENRRGRRLRRRRAHRGQGGRQGRPLQGPVRPPARQQEVSRRGSHRARRVPQGPHRPPQGLRAARRRGLTLGRSRASVGAPFTVHQRTGALWRRGTGGACGTRGESCAELEVAVTPSRDLDAPVGELFSETVTWRGGDVATRRGGDVATWRGGEAATRRRGEAAAQT